MSKIFTLAVIAVAALLATITTVAVVQYLGLIPTSGEITYSIEPSTISWDTIPLGIMVNRTLNITNVSPSPVTLNASVWNVNGNLTDFALSWDAEGLTLSSDEWVLANFSLTVYDNSGEKFFDFDIVISDQT